MFQKRKALSATPCSALWSFVVWLAGQETVIGRWSASHLQWFQGQVEGPLASLEARVACATVPPKPVQWLMVDGAG